MQDFDEDDELQDLSDIDFDDVEEFNDSDDGDALDDELISNLNEKLKTKNSKSKQNKKKGIDNNMFVSAEKFAEMLEEQNKTKGKHGGSNIFSSGDGASAKQIDWEVKRHQRLKGSFDKKKRKSVQSSNNKRAKKFKR